jgi:hypothetical protein
MNTKVKSLYTSTFFKLKSLKILIINFIILINTITAFSQNDTTTAGKWIPIGTLSLNLNQVALSNWSQGGDNSLAITFIGNFGMDYADNIWNFATKLKTMFGINKTGEDELKIIENEIYFDNVLTYKIGWFINPYISNLFRTSITTGYDYKKNPKLEIVSFFDPGYLTQSLGFSYNIFNTLKTRLGLAFQETFANKFTNFTDRPSTTEIENFKFETGIESVTDFEQSIDENLLYKSLFRLFGRFEEIHTWDVRWDNIITASISKYFNVNFTFLIVYEKQQSLKTQIKEALQLGITFNLF